MGKNSDQQAYGAPHASPTGSYPAPHPNPYSSPYGAPQAHPPPPMQPHQPGVFGGGGAPVAAAAYPAPHAHGVGNPFASLTPSTFPLDMDPRAVACFKAADKDGSGKVDDKELQKALSSYDQDFSIRTVRLLMYLFTNSNVRMIGPKEFSSVFHSLQNWRATFERFDCDRSGKIEANELREALLSLGFAVSPVVLELLVSKYNKSGGKKKAAIEYDNFIECCLTVKGLTEKFKEKDPLYSGSGNFTYEAFMLTVLPFLVA
ncbi:putative calcium-binding protein CML50 [Acorus calamus]|uniref:Calcium-binding protein CML50 n=1 Tax=Acorus calamus TaxID=4465 RepID=A0AAV9CRZ3_ACOCL|nr:putative calcium-binding protein CML50 [Acorus calamus]